MLKQGMAFTEQQLSCGIYTVPAVHAWDQKPNGLKELEWVGFSCLFSTQVAILIAACFT